MKKLIPLFLALLLVLLPLSALAEKMTPKDEAKQLALAAKLAEENQYWYAAALLYDRAAQAHEDLLDIKEAHNLYESARTAYDKAGRDEPATFANFMAVGVYSPLMDPSSIDALSVLIGELEAAGKLSQPYILRMYAGLARRYLWDGQNREDVGNMAGALAFYQEADALAERHGNAELAQTVREALVRLGGTPTSVPSGFTLSQGNLWIIAAGAGVILAVVAAVAIHKKRKN